MPQRAWSFGPVIALLPALFNAILAAGQAPSGFERAYGHATTSVERANDLKVDPATGSIYMVGFTPGELPTAIITPAPGGEDCFIAKLNFGNLGGTTHFRAMLEHTGWLASTNAITVTVADNALQLQCPTQVPDLPVAEGCLALMPAVVPVQLGDDSTPSSAILLSQVPQIGTPLNAGVYDVVLIATDQSGNTASCSSLVQVIDPTPFIISCPANITVNTALNLCGAHVPFTVTIGTSCDPSPVITYSHAPGSLFPVGSTLVTVSASTITGQNASCSFMVTVVDNIAPTITCPESQLVTAPSGLCGSVVNYATPVATDNCTIPAITLTQGLASGSSFPVGTTWITYQANGNASPSNSATCQFFVAVVDREAPATPVVNVSTNTDAGQCSALAYYSLPNIIDNCDQCPNATTLTGYTLLGSHNGNTYYFRNTNARWAEAYRMAAVARANLVTINNAAENVWLRNAVNVTVGNVRFWIGLNDMNTEGTFTWLNNQPLTYTNWGIGEPNGSNWNEDVCEMRLDGTWNDERLTTNLPFVIEVAGGCLVAQPGAGLAPGSNFPLGNTSGSYLATDAFGNRGTGAVNVTVVDGEAPNIVCPADLVLSASALNCMASAMYSAQVTDNCTSAPVLSYSHAPGSLFPLGITTIEVTATDGTSISTCSFTVTVVDDQPCGCGDTQPGQPCDDGNPATGNDTWTTDCNCQGQPLDCAGTPGGSAYIDPCGFCVEGITGLAPCPLDCNGDLSGSAVLDDCGTCVGGNTGLDPCEQDCAGVWGGTASIDNCGTCAGGSTGAGACEEDCAGIWGGTAYLDNCGICSGGSSGQEPCAPDCLGNWGGNALPGTPCHDGITQTLNDVWGEACQCTGEPLPCTSQAGTDQIVCSLNTVLDAEGAGQWTAPAGVTLTDPTLPAAMLSVIAPGTYVLQWTVSWENCIAVDEVSITFAPPIDATFSYANDIICPGSMPPTPWTANPGGVFTAVGDGLELDQLTGTIFPAASGVGSYTIIHAFDGPCPSAYSTVVNIAPESDPSWTPPLLPVCANNEPIDLDGMVTGDAAGTWTGAGVQAGSFDPHGLNGPIEITRITGTEPCTRAHPGIITVVAAPEVDAGPDASTCGLEHELSASSSGGTGTWLLPSGISSANAASDPNSVISSSTYGTFTLTWLVTDDLCNAQDQVTVEFLPDNDQLWANAGPDQLLYRVESTKLVGSASPEAILLWEVIDGYANIEHASAGSTMANGLTPGANTFVLHAFVGDCSRTTDTVLVMLEELFIPEGFSPNGDGTNDRFEITGLHAFPSSNLTVFNRWGQEVYSSTGYRNEWDGSSRKGLPLPNDTYFYVLNLGGEHAYNGHVIIKR